MKLIFKKQQITYYLLLVLVFFPILPNAILSITIVVFCIFSILFHWKTGVNNWKIDKGIPLVYNVTFMLILCTTLFYSEDKISGFKSLQSSFSLLILPLTILYFQPKYSKKQYELTLLLFVLANILFTLYFIDYINKNAIQACYPELTFLNIFQKIKYLPNLSYENLLWCANQYNTPKILIHKTYNSMSLVFSNLLIVYFIKDIKNKNFIKTLLILTFIFFSLIIFFFYSIPNIIFFIAMLLMFFFIKNIKSIAITSVFIFSAIPLLTSNLNLENNYSGLLKEKKNDGIKERKMINYCNYLVIKNNYAVGLGVGDFQNSLNKCYSLNLQKNKFYKKALKHQLNSHNYFYFLIGSGGLILLFSFLALIYYDIKISIDNNCIILLIFIMLISFNLFTENILSRIYGAVFFGLFGNLLIKYSTIKEV